MIFAKQIICASAQNATCGQIATQFSNKNTARGLFGTCAGIFLNALLLTSALCAAPALSQSLSFSSLALGGKDVQIATLSAGETLEVELELRSNIVRPAALGEALWGEGTYSLTLNEDASAAATPAAAQSGASARADFSVPRFAGIIALKTPAASIGGATRANCGLINSQKKLTLNYPAASAGALNAFLTVAADFAIRFDNGQVVSLEAYYRSRKVVAGAAGAWGAWTMLDGGYEGRAASFVVPAGIDNTRATACGGVLPTAAGPLWMAIFADD